MRFQVTPRVTNPQLLAIAGGRRKPESLVIRRASIDGECYVNHRQSLGEFRAHRERS